MRIPIPIISLIVMALFIYLASDLNFSYLEVIFGCVIIVLLSFLVWLLNSYPRINF